MDMTVKKTSMHFYFFYSLDELNEIASLLKMILIGRHHEQVTKAFTPENLYIAGFISFCEKMIKSSVLFSDKPGQEMFANFECDFDEYEAALFIFEHSAVYHSQLDDNRDKNADTAIHSALIAKRLRQALVLPDLAILVESEEGIFLEDSGRGKISVADSAELLCRIFAEHKRIFYMDTEKQWTELVHSDGVFQHFAPVADSEINRMTADFL
jgi:hypothetical protein